MPRITLKTIAKEAGVSIATVSIALRGQGKLAESNVKRIREIADRLGYRPNPMLASLASRRFRSGEQSQGLPLALLEFPSFESDTESTKQYREFLIKHAKSLGYAPLVYSTTEMRRYQDFTRILYHRGTVAVIVTGQPDADTFKDHARWQSFALVQCGRYRTILPLHTVRSNIVQAIKLCFDNTYSKGYRRIGFALGRHAETLEDDLARLGAAMALIDQHLEPEERIPPYFGPINDKECMIAWAKEHKPEVYIAFNSGFWFALKDAGIHCPRDAAFVAIHTHQSENAQHQKIHSGLDQSLDEIANQTLLLVDQMVRHNERGIIEDPRHILIRSKWVEGETLPPKA